MADSVRDAQQIIFRVVGVGGHVQGGVGHAGEAVGVVIGVTSGLAVLVGDGGAASPSVIAKAYKRRVRVGDFGQAVAQVVVKGGAVLHGIHHGGPISAQIVFISRHIELIIGDGVDQPGWIVIERRMVVERICNLSQLAFGVIGELGDARGGVLA